MVEMKQMMARFIEWQKKQTSNMLQNINRLRNYARLNRHYGDEHMHRSGVYTVEELKEMGIEEKYQWLELPTPFLASFSSAYEIFSDPATPSTQPEATSTTPAPPSSSASAGDI